jgi:hypothetical protein
MARVAPAKQDFRLVFRLINNDERSGILRLNARMEADTLPFDKMARDRRHDRFLRGFRTAPAIPARSQKIHRRAVAPLAVRDAGSSPA